jgi:hypothetical protein
MALGDLAGARRTIPGVDLWAAFATPRLATSVGYSVLLDRSTGPLESTPAGAASTRHGRIRHLVSTSITAIAGRARASLSGAFARGLPYASVVLDRPGEVWTIPLGGPGVDPTGGPEVAGAGGSHPDGSLLRLDATLGATWERRWGGGDRAFSLTPYIRLINALDRRDGLFYYDDGTSDRPRALGTVPAIVTVGVSWDVGPARRRP